MPNTSNNESALITDGLHFEMQNGSEDIDVSKPPRETIDVDTMLGITSEALERDTEHELKRVIEIGDMHASIAKYLHTLAYIRAINIPDNAYERLVAITEEEKFLIAELGRIEVENDNQPRFVIDRLKKPVNEGILALRNKFQQIVNENITAGDKAPELTVVKIGDVNADREGIDDVTSILEKRLEQIGLVNPETLSNHSVIALHECRRTAHRMERFAAFTSHLLENSPFLPDTPQKALYHLHVWKPLDPLYRKTAKAFLNKAKEIAENPATDGHGQQELTRLIKQDKPFFKDINDLLSSFQPPCQFLVKDLDDDTKNSIKAFILGLKNYQNNILQALPEGIRKIEDTDDFAAKMDNTSVYSILQSLINLSNLEVNEKFILDTQLQDASLTRTIALVLEGIITEAELDKQIKSCRERMQFWHYTIEMDTSINKPKRIVIGAHTGITPTDVKKLAAKWSIPCKLNSILEIAYTINRVNKRFQQEIQKDTLQFTRGNSFLGHYLWRRDGYKPNEERWENSQWTNKVKICHGHVGGDKPSPLNSGDSNIHSNIDGYSGRSDARPGEERTNPIEIHYGMVMLPKDIKLVIEKLDALMEKVDQDENSPHRQTIDYYFHHLRSELFKSAETDGIQKANNPKIQELDTFCTTLDTVLNSAYKDKLLSYLSPIKDYFNMTLDVPPASTYLATWKYENEFYKHVNKNTKQLYQKTITEMLKAVQNIVKILENLSESNGETLQFPIEQVEGYLVKAGESFKKAEELVKRQEFAAAKAVYQKIAETAQCILPASSSESEEAAVLEDKDAATNRAAAEPLPAASHKTIKDIATEVKSDKALTTHKKFGRDAAVLAGIVLTGIIIPILIVTFLAGIADLIKYTVKKLMQSSQSPDSSLSNASSSYSKQVIKHTLWRPTKTETVLSEMIDTLEKQPTLPPQ